MNKHDSIGRHISILYRYGSCYIGKELEKYNIGKGQYTFLVTLFRYDGIRQEDLSELLNIDKGTTARAIKKLEEEGYVVRKINPEDRRSYGVYITDKARSIGEDILNTLNKWNDVISIDFTKEEKELSLDLLKRMTENAVKFKKGKL